MMENAHFEVWNIEISGLALDFKVNPSSCGNPEYFEQFIKYCAISDNKSGLYTTHALIDDTANKLMGFVSLKMSSMLQTFEGVILGEPALEISNLAVSASYERMGVGRELIDFVIRKALAMNKKSVGIKYITLAADAKAVGFYNKMEFNELRDYFEIPRQQDNQNCIPMFMQMRYDVNDISYAGLDLDDEEET